MPAPDHRLTTLEMARFVGEGYLRFDALVPDALNRRVLEELPKILAAKMATLAPAVGKGEPPRTLYDLE